MLFSGYVISNLSNPSYRKDWKLVLLANMFQSVQSDRSERNDVNKNNDTCERERVPRIQFIKVCPLLPIGRIGIYRISIKTSQLVHSVRSDRLEPHNTNETTCHRERVREKNNHEALRARRPNTSLTPKLADQLQLLQHRHTSSMHHRSSGAPFLLLLRFNAPRRARAALIA